MDINTVSPMRKDGTPKKKNGRPSNAEKPLGQADLTKMARKLGKVTDEALDLIIGYMQKAETPEKEKVRIATQIVGTVQALISQVDRQTLMKKNLAMLDAKMAEENIPKLPDDGDNGLNTPSATVLKFTTDIVE